MGAWVVERSHPGRGGSPPARRRHCHDAIRIASVVAASGVIQRRVHHLEDQRKRYPFPLPASDDRNSRARSQTSTALTARGTSTTSPRLVTLSSSGTSPVVTNCAAVRLVTTPTSDSGFPSSFTRPSCRFRHQSPGERAQPDSRVVYRMPRFVGSEPFASRVVCGVFAPLPS